MSGDEGMTLVYEHWDSGPYGWWAPVRSYRPDDALLVPTELMRAYQEACDAKDEAESALDDFRARHEMQSHLQSTGHEGFAPDLEHSSDGRALRCLSCRKLWIVRPE